MKYFTGKRFTLSQVVILLVIMFVAIAAISYASSIGTLTTFSSGSAISSSAMNTNFSTIKTAVNDNYTQISSQSSRITALETKQTVTVIVQSGTLSPGGFTATSATCPSGYKAIGGGVDNSNVWHMYISSSNPLINGIRTVLTANGQTSTALNGWYGGAGVLSTAPAGSYYFKVAAICQQL